VAETVGGDPPPKLRGEGVQGLRPLVEELGGGLLGEGDEEGVSELGVGLVLGVLRPFRGGPHADEEGARVPRQLHRAGNRG